MKELAGRILRVDPQLTVCPASAMLFMMFRVKLAHFLVPLPSTPALFDTMARHNAPHTSTLRLQKM